MVGSFLRGLVVAFALNAAVARAQDAGCETPAEIGPVDVLPADAANGVKLNSFVRVRYSAGYFAGASTPTETIALSTAGMPVDGRLELAGDDTLYFIPSTPLVPDALYEGEATGAAFPFVFSFRTGSGGDVANPDLREPSQDDSFEIDASPAEGGCVPAGSRRVRLSFTSANDDGPASSVEYWVYLSRAEALAAPRLLTRVRDFGADVTTIGVVLSPAESSSSACITVVAVDGVDRSAQWASPACFDPNLTTGFVGLCEAAHGRTNASAWLPVAVGLTLLVLRSRALTRASRS